MAMSTGGMEPLTADLFGSHGLGDVAGFSADDLLALLGGGNIGGQPADFTASLMQQPNTTSVPFNPMDMGLSSPHSYGLSSPTPGQVA